MSAADGKRILQKICKEFQGPLQLGLKHVIGFEAKHPAMR
jgi:hypothetical protein